MPSSIRCVSGVDNARPAGAVVTGAGTGVDGAVVAVLGTLTRVSSAAGPAMTDEAAPTLGVPGTGTGMAAGTAPGTLWFEYGLL